MVRLILPISALLLLPGCGRKDGDTPPRAAVVRPELKVDLKEKVGQVVEVTGLLAAVSTDGTKEQDKWVGEMTATLECKGMTLECKFPRATKAPDWFKLDIVGVRLLTVRGTVASVEPAGKATLTDCVAVGDPNKP